MKYRFFGGGDSATKLIKKFSDLRKGDTLYNSSDEDDLNRIGIQINDLLMDTDDVQITIIKNGDNKQRIITEEQLEKIIWY